MAQAPVAEGTQAAAPGPQAGLSVDEESYMYSLRFGVGLLYSYILYVYLCMHCNRHMLYVALRDTEFVRRCNIRMHLNAQG